MLHGRLHNKVVRITLGRVGRLSLTDARNAVERIRGDAAKGIDVVAVRKALASKKPTAERLEDRFERFLAGDRHRPKTVKDYRSLWTLHIAPTLANKAVDDIQPEDLQKLHAAVASRVGSGKKAIPGRTKPGHRTANKVLALLRAVMGGRAIDVSMFPQRDRRRRLTDEEALGWGMRSSSLRSHGVSSSPSACTPAPAARAFSRCGGTTSIYGGPLGRSQPIGASMVTKCLYRSPPRPPRSSQR